MTKVISNWLRRLRTVFFKRREESIEDWELLEFRNLRPTKKHEHMERHHEAK
jgi:hypothetical protein